MGLQQTLSSAVQFQLPFPRCFHPHIPPQFEGIMSFSLSYIRTGKGYADSTNTPPQRRKQEHAIQPTELKKSFRIKLLLFIIHTITPI